MIDIREVEIIHSLLIEKFGGSKGIRDKSLLESALSRPFATFGGIDLYPTAVEKAAAIIESILINHPFIDGNKRTGYVLMRLLLLHEKHDIEASENEKFDFVLSISMGKMDIEEIKAWIKGKIKKSN
jgi:death on curing protein